MTDQFGIGATEHPNTVDSIGLYCLSSLHTYIALHYVALRYVTLHNIHTYMHDADICIHIYICTDIYIYIYIYMNNRYVYIYI